MIPKKYKKDIYLFQNYTAEYDFILNIKQPLAFDKTIFNFAQLISLVLSQTLSILMMRDFICANGFMIDFSLFPLHYKLRWFFDQGYKQ